MILMSLEEAMKASEKEKTSTPSTDRLTETLKTLAGQVFTTAELAERLAMPEPSTRRTLLALSRLPDAIVKQAMVVRDGRERVGYLVEAPKPAEPKPKPEPRPRKTKPYETKPAGPTETKPVEPDQELETKGETETEYKAPGLSDEASAAIVTDPPYGVDNLPGEVRLAKRRGPVQIPVGGVKPRKSVCPVCQGHAGEVHQCCTYPGCDKTATGDEAVAETFGLRESGGKVVAQPRCWEHRSARLERTEAAPIAEVA